MNYDPEDLIPIVAELTDLYTRGESTSVTYEAAQHLMEAVLYCIHEAEQRFLAKFPPGYVEEILRSYTADYKDQFFNLSEIVFKCKTDPIE